MSNTLNGLAYTNIAQMGLKAFGAALMPITKFTTTDFSTDAAIGGTVVTRIVPVSNAAVKLSDYSNDRTNANVSGDITTTLVTVTLDTYAVGFQLTDTEVSKIQANTLGTFKNQVIEQKVNSLAKKCQDVVLALVTSGNYSGNCSSIAYTSFDLDEVNAVRTAVNKLDWSGPQQLVINSDVAGNLRKESAIQSRLDSGKDTIETGIIGKLAGFDIIEMHSLPTTNSLQGFATTGSGIAVAARIPITQGANELMAYEPMQDPATGIPLVYRAFYYAPTGSTYHTFEVDFGASVGDTEALKRCVSA